MLARLQIIFRDINLQEAYYFFSGYSTTALVTGTAALVYL